MIPKFVANVTFTDEREILARQRLSGGAREEFV